MAVKLGVAGLGWLGESLIKDTPRVDGLEVVAVQDVLPPRASEIAARYAIGCWTDRFADLLVRADVDAVAVCTPNAFHAEQAQAALRAGKHVLVQKPLALSARDADATLLTASDSGSVLFVDYTYRFLESVLRLQQQLRDLRPIESVAATFHNIYGPGAEKTWFFDPKLSGGGALTDLGVHLLDLGLWLLRPESVELQCVQLHSAGVVENAAHLRLLLDAVPFSVDVSWSAALPATDISFVVNGRGGSVRWHNVDGSFFHFRTLRDNVPIADRETTLREDTLRAFTAAVDAGRGPHVDTRVYAVLDQAYGRPR